MCRSERQLCLQSESDNLRWLILLVQRGYELKVQKSLASLRNIPAIVPVRMETKQWADRTVVKPRVLLPGYVIAQVDLSLRGQIVGLPRVYEFLRFGEHRAYLSDEEVETLRRITERTIHPESWELLEVGQRVRIMDGPLAGCQGEVVEREHDHYFSIRLPMLGRQIAIKIDLSTTEVVLMPHQNN
jgi:transcription antitermination factor NusG